MKVGGNLLLEVLVRSKDGNVIEQSEEETRVGRLLGSCNGELLALLELLGDAIEVKANQRLALGLRKRIHFGLGAAALGKDIVDARGTRAYNNANLGRQRLRPPNEVASVVAVVDLVEAVKHPHDFLLGLLEDVQRLLDPLEEESRNVLRVICSGQRLGKAERVLGLRHETPKEVRVARARRRAADMVDEQNVFRVVLRVAATPVGEQGRLSNTAQASYEERLGLLAKDVLIEQHEVALVGHVGARETTAIGHVAELLAFDG